MSFYQGRGYLKHTLKSYYKKGQGFDDPFVFGLVKEVINCPYSYYAFDRINYLRRKLEVSKEKIDMIDHGEGSTVFKGQSRRVSRLIKASSIAPKYGELLFRIVNYFKPRSILELGTSIGMSTAYMATALSSSKIVTIEGCANTAKVAADNFDTLNCRNIRQVNGRFQDVLLEVIKDWEPIEVAYFDGHHEKQATLDYFEACLKNINEDSIFIFDDIYWSKGMQEAWHLICDHPKVTLSIDLFQLGLVFFRKDCKRQKLYLQL